MDQLMSTQKAASLSESVKPMEVVKRNGAREAVSFDKITLRIRQLSKTPTVLHVDAIKVAQKVIESLFDGVTTRELDELAGQISASMSLDHPDYSNLAGRIAVSNHQKNTANSFYKVVKQLYDATDIGGKHAPIVSKELFDIVKKHRKEIEDAIDYDRDFLYDYFGFQTLMRSYLMKIRGVMVERIQHMWMRVALGIHGDDVESALETYHLMSQRYFTHATPTLFNSGTGKPQMSSCFLVGMEDSIDGIFKTLTQCAQISKYAGGIGFWAHDIRAKNSHIHGTNGQSNGLVPMLKVFNHTARYVDQCHADASIYTSTGLKHIRDVAYGDEVLTGAGTFCSVCRLLEHEFTGKVIKVTAGGTSVTVTPTQQLLVLRTMQPLSRVAADSFKYMDAADLTVGDYLCKAIPTHEKDVPELDIDDCKILGMMLRTGSVPGMIQTSTQAELDYVTAYFEKRVVHTVIIDGRVWWEPAPSFPLTESLAFDAIGAARLFAGALHLPLAKASALLEGVLGDDCFYVGNLQVAQGLHYLLLRTGQQSYCDGDTLRVAAPDTYVVRERKLIMRIDALDMVPFDRPVYDLVLGGAGADSYTSEVGTAHHGRSQPRQNEQ